MAQPVRVKSVATTESSVLRMKISEAADASGCHLETIRYYERTGLLPRPGRWSGSSKATMSYGYGLNVTPLQIATAYSALGNG
ncbi:MerR family DNA-binding transcriptional regulator, partial [Stenotrophomonas sp. GbtcB23]|uniref:MerR family DNA-binding transcriptional regulator n=1 Tax=Stenotrophomonas sp. GbtcB23 TaxID=2824768 RepID=UPI0026719CC8